MSKHAEAEHCKQLHDAPGEIELSLAALAQMLSQHLFEPILRKINTPLTSHILSAQVEAMQIPNKEQMSKVSALNQAINLNIHSVQTSQPKLCPLMLVTFECQVVYLK